MADETAAPAVCSILEDLDRHARGAAFLEVPVSRDATALAGQVAPSRDPDLWETPTYSSSGEEADVPVATVGHELDELYAWIAGESGCHVMGRQVAFMGYWRRGVAMRS